MQPPLFLCCIQDRKTGKVHDFVEMPAVDWYFARHKAAAWFRENGAKALPPEFEDWWVDSVEIDRPGGG